LGLLVAGPADWSGLHRLVGWMGERVGFRNFGFGFEKDSNNGIQI
jgi:hypothetical protein